MTERMDARPLPHSLEAERAVLGVLMVQPELYDGVAAIVHEADFFRLAHRRVWAAIGRLHERGVPADLLTVHQALTDAGEIEDPVGGPAYLASLIDHGPRGTNVEHYARVLREKTIRRRLIASAQSMLADAYADIDDVELLVDRAERAVMEVGHAAVARGDFVLAEDWMREVMGQVDIAAATKRIVTGVPSGLPLLDRSLRGFQAGDLVLIGARPSTGKTALMLQMALHASAEHMTGIVSLEMGRSPIGFRAVGLEARIETFRLMTGELSEYEQRRAGQAIQRIAERRLAIDDASGQNPAGIRAKVRRLAQRYGLGIVFLDYLQLLRGGERHESRNQEISQISGGLKDLARELQIPVVVLSQLSRDSEKAGGNRRPQLWHLRDSGALEQDADVVLLLHRPGQHSDGDRYRDGEDAELIIAKQRNGPTGLIKLQWVAEQMRFAERAEDAAPPTEPRQERFA